MTVRLEELLAAATPGPWEHRGLGVWGGEGRYEIAGWARHTSTADFDLIALAPDAVRLLIDMEPDLRKLAICQIGGDMEGEPACCAGCHLASLLARLDRLGNTT